MKKTIHVGFWFDFGLAYAGGLNYFRNLLHAVHSANPEHVQVTLFIGKDLPPKLLEEFQTVANVVLLDILTRGTLPWFFHRLSYRGLRSQVFVERELRRHGVDVVSHPSMVERLNPRYRVISWIPDFQYLHMPHLFPGLDVERRSAELRVLHRNSNAVVVSSEDAFKDFAQVMGEDQPARTHVLPFVSQLHLGPTSPKATRALLHRYSLPERFFFLPNQFWAHKNHRAAFEAVAQLKREGLDITLVCTGWIKDPNGNTLANNALRVLDEQNLHQQVRLLGSIEYADVQGLMRACVAVVNPSFFEGWSSSVEEAKSMGKPLIASDLAVHREQAHPRAEYFDPNDPSALAALLRKAWQTLPGGVDEVAEVAARIELQRRTVEFGQRYLKILGEVAPAPCDLHYTMSSPLGFVVLNYVNYDETVRCVESIMALPGDAPIVVVDNASPNGAFDILAGRYADVLRVTVLQSERNGGYSSGNNVGIRALRERGIINVVIATSDTRVESLDLIDRCLAARDAGAAVVGPYVRGDEPGSDNPMLQRLTLQYIAAIHLGKLWTALKKILLRTGISPRSKRIPDSAHEGCSTALVDVYMVHGCFLFLSEHYLSVFDELDEDLFMYGEEDLIAFNCIRRGLRVVYDPRMVVYHGDAKSTSPGEFRLRAVAASMATLRRKIRFGPLIHAYLRSL